MLWKRNGRTPGDPMEWRRQLPPEYFWEVPPPPKERYWLNVLLFAATVLTTTMAGAMQRNIDPFSHPIGLIYGFPFAGTLLLILGVHEFGHYFASRWWGVRATLPYFIPAPSFIGTFGAVIRMKSPIPNRGALVDIGAAGPIAGFVIAVAASVYGLGLSEVVEIRGLPMEGGLILGDSLLFSLLSRWVIGVTGDGYDIVLHPIAFAGWLGLFVTALNLLPIGQLDGGHIVYSLIGRRHETVSKVAVLALLPMGLLWPGWLFWAFLSIIFGRRHPPPSDLFSPLDGRRKVIAYLSLAIFILCFIPKPFSGW